MSHSAIAADRAREKAKRIRACTDYEAEARNALADAYENAPDATRRSQLIAEAQVWATLYLAQRTRDLR